MQLMRWSINRRLDGRPSDKQRRTCQQPSRLNAYSGEENDSASDNEEQGAVPSGAAAIEVQGGAVDLTSTRSQHEDELLDDDEEMDEPEDITEEHPQQLQHQQASLKTKQLVNDEDDDDEDDEDDDKRMHLCQDAENNNSFVEGAVAAPPLAAAAVAAGLFPSAGTSHVTLEALQNTKVAVAQFAATALAGGADSEAALQELAVLQNTLFTLQHQQVFQLQLISQLQQQLTTAAQVPSGSESSGVAGAPSRPESKEASPSPAALIHPKPLSSLTSPAHSRPPSSHLVQQPRMPSPPMIAREHQERPTPADSASPLAIPLISNCVVASSPPITSTPTTTSSAAMISHMPITASHQVPALCSISSSLASSIITNNDPMPLNEPNTLEMLQKRAQEVLDNASQGLLANNLADELAFRGSKSRMSPYDGKSGSGGRSEPFFKHRCRYCGKVFGSDSALQIHIRSHTGERPYKCNVCGSRFTTKGNLKVHFQRHRDKFPHVKMNPNPVPEHLDKYHPHLLQQLAACGQRSPPPNSGPIPPPQAPPPQPFHPGATSHGVGPVPFLPPQPPMALGLALPQALYRSPLQLSASSLVPPTSMPAPPTLSMPLREEQDGPADLSKPSPSHSPQHSPNSHHSYSEPQQHHHKQDEDLVKTEHEHSPHRDFHQAHQQPQQLQQQPRPLSREGAVAESITPKNEPEESEDMNDDDAEDFEADSRRYANSSPANQSAHHHQMYEDCSMDSSKMSTRMDANDMEADEDMDEQPENLSSRANPASMLQQSMVYPGASPTSSSASSGSIQTSFANILFSGLPPHPPLHHPQQMQQPQQQQQQGGPARASSAAPTSSEPFDPARDPAIYSTLLPKPGSNDNSWESLIEITKTSETSKLQQLVDNIEHKLTDPNQCIICQRVLSCKSALQMHYRTHTGERPFKCKICGRAFTTKGNLKTHMGVHRAKPPLRMLHQCTVCHKKFANSFVLQQHVNLHTNDPTELTPEQIRAAEVHDFAPAGYPSHPLAAFLPAGFPPLHPAGFPLGFPPNARQHALERQSMEDADSKDSLHHQHQLQQHIHAQQQRYLEERANSAGCEDIDEEAEDEEEDRREDDERCGDERRSSLDGDEDKESRHQDMEAEMMMSTEHKDGGSVISHSPPSFSTSLAALESQVRTITTMAATNHHHHQQQQQQQQQQHQQQQQPPKAPSPLHRYNGSEKSNSPQAAPAPLDLTPRASSTPASNASSPPTTHHPFGMFAGLLQAAPTNNTPGGPLASLTSSAVRAATSTYNPLGLAVGGSAVRGNTTCNICYKTFACNSALEIHYRSHTKERPFKCTICERGFSTKNEDAESKSTKCNCLARARRSLREKERRRRRAEERCRGRTGGLDNLAAGANCAPTAAAPLAVMPSALGLLASDPLVLLGNMKQHMLTHKIRDMPHHLFGDSKSQPSLPSQQTPVQPPPPPPPQQPILPPASQPMHSEHHLQRERSRSPAPADESMPPQQPPPPPPNSLDASMPSMKKSIVPENDLSGPKRPPSISSKHLCHVCNKNFSSSSALQIHMRTHTGDKPFQCTVCQKAFTTKGNLKVHMGTHMWTNGASRRGRRMSLDIPSLPITPKDSEFLQRRPDLFYPYLPAPFLNGMPQKLNEISVIQGGNGLPMPNHPAVSKYAGLFNSVYAGGAHFPIHHPPPDHHPSSTPPPSPGANAEWNAAEAMRQYHYEREAAAAAHQRPDADGSPPRLPPPPPRGEGLAA